MARRKNLETIAVELKDLEKAIKQLKAIYGENTQIEVVESSIANFYFVTIWGL